MSHSPSSVTLHDVPTILTAEPFRLPKVWKTVALLFIGLGIVGFLRELSGEGNPTHAWATFQVNFIYWFCIAIASTGFSAVFHICNAQWSRPIRRLFEAGSSFIMVCPVLLLIPFFFRAYDHLFIWSHEEAPGKAEWLQPGYLYMRDVIAMVVLIALSRKIVHFSISRDITAVRGGLTAMPKEQLSRWFGKEYDIYNAASGSADVKETIRDIHSRMGRLSPVVVIVYALAMSLVAFDQEMSVDPYWYSTMFGAFVFMGAVYLAVAFVSMWVGVARLHPLFRKKVERRTLHDLGKLLFGFGIFWTYLFWSQYLPIWYGNMPEETHYLILRLREEPWHSVAWLVLGLCFFIPFLLGLSRDVKQIPQLLFATGAIVACGMWLQHYLLFVPSLFPTHVPFGFTEISVSLGFLGGYVLSVLSFLERAPLMPFGDLYVQEPTHH